MPKTAAAAALAATLSVGAGAGAVVFAPELVSAQTDDTTQEGDTQESESPESRGREPGRFLEDTLAPLVDDGTITQAQADAVIETLQDARPERVRGPGHRFPIADDLTDVLGLTGEELRTALEDGRTLAEIAEANGVDVQAVVDALVETVNGRIDAALENGRITEDEAADKRAEATERATDIVAGDDAGS